MKVPIKNKLNKHLKIYQLQIKQKKQIKNNN